MKKRLKGRQRKIKESFFVAEGRTVLLSDFWKERVD
jgi:hypothetical protein